MNEPRVMGRQAIDLFVLDGLADDLEDIIQLLKGLNHEEFGYRSWREGASFAREEVVAALARLIREELVEACVWSDEHHALVDAGRTVLPEGDWTDVWFRMTKRGRILHTAWCEEEDGK